jgi:hypothetical protein
MPTAKTLRGVNAFTCVFAPARYTSITSAETHLPSQVPKPVLTPAPNPTLEGATAMIKLVLAACAALSILASPVLAGPGGGSWDDVVQKSGDFQMQGR